MAAACREDNPLGIRVHATGISSRDVPCDVAVYASSLRKLARRDHRDG